MTNRQKGEHTVRYRQCSISSHNIKFVVPFAAWMFATVSFMRSDPQEHTRTWITSTAHRNRYTHRPASLQFFFFTFALQRSCNSPPTPAVVMALLRPMPLPIIFVRWYNISRALQHRPFRYIVIILLWSYFKYAYIPFLFYIFSLLRNGNGCK